LYLKDGKPAYTYNLLGMNRTTISGTTPVPAGKATVRFEFAYDGGGMFKGGTGTLFVNDEKVAEGRVERCQIVFSADEGTDVGEDGESPVIEDYGIAAPYRFTGEIDKVTIDVKPTEAADAQAHAQAQKEVAKKVAEVRE
jgi:arylsulfatase